MSNPLGEIAASSVWAAGSFWLGSILPAIVATAYFAFWGDPEPYLRGWSGFLVMNVIAGVLLTGPATVVLVAVALSPRVVRDNPRRLYALSACCGMLLCSSLLGALLAGWW